MKKKFIVYGIIAVVLVGGFLNFRSNGKEKSIVNVKTASAEEGEIKSYLSTTATVVSNDLKQYFGPQAVVKKIKVKVGDKVKKGDVLVEYETQDLNSTIKQAQIQYDNAVLQKNDLYNQNNDLKNKKEDLNKEIEELKNSNKPEDIAKISQLEQQRDAIYPISSERLKQADNSVSLAKISLDSAKKRLNEEQKYIKAENEGVVTDLNIVEGQIGNAMQAAVTVQDIEDLKAIVYLGKYDAKKVSLKQDVIVKSGDKQFKGTVSFIDPSAVKTVSATGGDTTLRAEIDILDETPDLKINFDVDVDILTDQAKGIITVPVESIKYDKDRTLVYSVEGDTVYEKEVEVSIQSATLAGIKEGLNAGDKVILNPSTSIKDGIKVTENPEVK